MTAGLALYKVSACLDVVGLAVYKVSAFCDVVGLATGGASFDCGWPFATSFRSFRWQSHVLSQVVSPFGGGWMVSLHAVGFFDSMTAVSLATSFDRSDASFYHDCQSRVSGRSIMCWPCYTRRRYSTAASAIAASFVVFRGQLVLGLLSVFSTTINWPCCRCRPFGLQCLPYMRRADCYLFGTRMI